MNFKKLALILPLFVSISMTQLQATDRITDSEPTWQDQMVSYLSTIDFDKYDDLENVMIDFMIVEGDKILIISTNEPEMDATLKNKLNYKTLSSTELEFYKKYTLPIAIQR